jgi:hypothetical protein
MNLAPANPTAIPRIAEKTIIGIASLLAIVVFKICKRTQI